MKPRIPLPPELAMAPFTIAEGADAGLGPNRLRGHDLYSPFRGVRISRSRTPSLHELCTGYQSTMHPSGRFCGPTAALLLGAPLPRRLEGNLPLHIAVPRGSRAPSGRAIRGHQFEYSDAVDAWVWNGLRLSTPERLWCELGALLRVDDLVAVGDYLIHWQAPFTTASALESAARGFAGHRGAVALREAAPLVSSRSESRQESKLRVIVVRALLPTVTANLTIITSGGFTYRGDLVFEAQKVILEYQSDYHRSPERFAADMTRVSRLEADGWIVMYVGSRDMDDPVELVSRIRRVLARRVHRATRVAGFGGTEPTGSTNWRNSPGGRFS